MPIVRQIKFEQPVRALFPLERDLLPGPRQRNVPRLEGSLLKGEHVVNSPDLVVVDVADDIACVQAQPAGPRPYSCLDRKSVV